MQKIIIFSLVTFLITSCGQEDKTPKKTPTIYGTEFCDCVIENNMDDTKCGHIIEENKKVYGADNKEAEEEFKAAAIQCITNKSRKKMEESN